MSDSSTRTDRQILEKTRHKTARPSLYKVFLLNDDYTTMEFVVEMLCEVFNKPTLEATRIMLFVHREGRGLAGIYPKDIAETKIETVHQRAQDRGFPLRCAMEKE
jgi:ATP-dependent Clp protease adaptor protein ClpS